MPENRIAENFFGTLGELLMYASRLFIIQPKEFRGNLLVDPADTANREKLASRINAGPVSLACVSERISST